MEIGGNAFGIFRDIDQGAQKLFSVTESALKSEAANDNARNIGKSLGEATAKIVNEAVSSAGQTSSKPTETIVLPTDDPIFSADNGKKQEFTASPVPPPKVGQSPVGEKELPFGEGQTETLPEGTPLLAPGIAAAVVVAGAIFAGYKYYQHQALARAEAKKAQEALEAEARKIAADKQAKAQALRLEEAHRLKLLKEACDAVQQTKTFNQSALNSLGINFCHIPLTWPEGAEALGYDVSNPFVGEDTAPIFNKEKGAEVEKIRAQIEESLTSEDELPLPNLLVAGVPGVGKTMLIGNLCKTCRIGYIKIPTGLLESRLTQGTSNETLNTILKVAESSSVPVYIVLDDGEGLFDKSAANFRVEKEDDSIELPWSDAQDRMNSNDIISKRRRQLVQAILDYAKKPDRKVSFALTTNRSQVVDEQFSEVTVALEVPPPEKPERIKILIQGLTRVFGKDHPVLGYFTRDRVSRLADKTDGFTGRNIIKMLETLYSLVNGDPNIITDELIDSAVKQTIPSVEKFRERAHQGNDAR